MNRGFIGALCLSVAFALLAGCGGSEPPIGAPGTIANATQRDRSSLGRDGLLYVSLPYNVEIYTYPKGKPYASMRIPGGANAMCTDDVGNVFITEGDGHVAEYAHGATKPTASVLLRGDPYSCAFDRITGSLAVSNQGGAIEIFAKFPSEPTIYSLPAAGNLYFCTYDGHGNLFVDGRWIQRHKTRNGLLETRQKGAVRSLPSLYHLV